MHGGQTTDNPFFFFCNFVYCFCSNFLLFSASFYAFFLFFLFSPFIVVFSCIGCFLLIFPSRLAGLSLLFFSLFLSSRLFLYCLSFSFILFCFLSSQILVFSFYWVVIVTCYYFPPILLVSLSIFPYIPVGYWIALRLSAFLTHLLLTLIHCVPPLRLLFFLLLRLLFAFLLFLFLLILFFSSSSFSSSSSSSSSASSSFSSSSASSASYVTLTNKQTYPFSGESMCFV